MISIRSFAVVIVGTRVGLHGFFGSCRFVSIVNSIIVIESHKVGNGLRITQNMVCILSLSLCLCLAE